MRGFFYALDRSFWRATFFSSYGIELWPRKKEAGPFYINSYITYYAKQERAVKVKKILSIFLAILIGGYIGAFLKLPTASAEEPEVSVIFQALPFVNYVPAGYLNADNTGFATTAILAEGYTPYSLGLFLDNGSNPIDDDRYVGLLSYTLTSETNSLTELKSLLQYDNPSIPKEHILYLKVQMVEGGGYDTVWQYSFTADFDSPTGTISYLTQTASDTTPGWLKVGDSATFTLALGASDTSNDVTVAGSYNGHLLDRSAGVAPNEFNATYTVAAGDLDQAVPLPISDVILTDKAGNTTTLSETNVAFTIDANAPTVAIHSPENGKSYNTASIALDYLASDPSEVTLDGSPTTLQNGDPIGPLVDGSYTVAVKSTDLAGNSTSVAPTFTVDTIAPFISIASGPGGQKIEQGSAVTFSGMSEPNSLITAEIFSEPQTASTVANNNGEWEISFDSSNLEVGQHNSYIESKDRAGNINKIAQAIEFEIIPKPQAVSDTPASETTKVALSSGIERAVLDVAPAVAACEGTTCQIQPGTEEIAKSGQTLSSEDARNAGVNWSAWIILLAIIVLASALATAGYYGYGWVTAPAARRAARREPMDISPEDIALAAEIKEKLRKREERTKKEEESPPRTRW